MTPPLCMPACTRSVQRKSFNRVALGVGSSTIRNEVASQDLCTMPFPELFRSSTHVRFEVLHIHAKNMKFAEDVDLERIAKDTHGYDGVGQDSLH